MFHELHIILDLNMFRFILSPLIHEYSFLVSFLVLVLVLHILQCLISGAPESGISLNLAVRETGGGDGKEHNRNQTRKRSRWNGCEGINSLIKVVYEGKRG